MVLGILISAMGRHDRSAEVLNAAAAEAAAKTALWALAVVLRSIRSVVPVTLKLSLASAFVASLVLVIYRGHLSLSLLSLSILFFLCSNRNDCSPYLETSSLLVLFFCG
jgi:hypothetical protein